MTDILAKMTHCDEVWAVELQARVLAKNGGKEPVERSECFSNHTRGGSVGLQSFSRESAAKLKLVQ